MFRIVGAGLLSLIAIGLPCTGAARAQTTTKVSPGQGANAPSGAAAIDPRVNEVAATVTTHNQTNKVTRGEVVGLLSQYPLPPADEREIAYRTAVDLLVNANLLNLFLTAQRVEVPEAKIDEQIERMKEQLKRNGQGDLPSMLLQSGMSMDDLRKNEARRLRWSEFVKTKATDAELRKFLNQNRDRFSGTQVRASHILRKLDPNATPEQKAKVKQQVEAIRQEILSGKLSFAAAANKYSEDPANAGGAGGDLDYFTLDSGFVEEFANAAFKLKKGEISQPVETPFGFHLIQVTDRKDGKLPDFEKVKPYIVQAYSKQLNDQIVGEERKSAKIEVKPMPKDFFPSEPAPPASSPAAGGTAAPRP